MERISLARVYTTAQNNIARNFAKVFDAQTQLTTGRRINRASDDLVGTRRLMTLQGEVQTITQYQDNAAGARSALNAGADNLQELSTVLARVRELAIQGANASVSPTDRQNIAAEVDALLRNAVSTLNVKFEGRFLFSGTATDSLPFRLQEGQDGVTRVSYQGNDDLQEVDLAPGLRLAINVPGSTFLGSTDRGTTRFRGDTGAAAGTGLPSGIGRDQLQVAHTQTSYGSPSGPNGADPITGLRPSASSPDDTVLGSAHTVLVTTDATGSGSITLNGGVPIAFTNADTDLRVVGPNGEAMNVDVSGLAPNLPPDTPVPILGEGTLSTDGGRSTVAIDFANANQQVVDEETGSVLYVDSRNIARSGIESITYSGTADVLSSIVAIRDTLLQEGDDANDEITAAINELDRGIDDVALALGRLGARSAQIESVEGRLADVSVTLQALDGEIRDADLVQVVSDLTRHETLYQASLSLATRIGRLSLLDFI